MAVEEFYESRSYEDTLDSTRYYHNTMRIFGTEVNYNDELGNGTKVPLGSRGSPEYAVLMSGIPILGELIDSAGKLLVCRRRTATRIAPNYCMVVCEFGPADEAVGVVFISGSVGSQIITSNEDIYGRPIGGDPAKPTTIERNVNIQSISVSVLRAFNSAGGLSVGEYVATYEMPRFAPYVNHCNSHKWLGWGRHRWLLNGVHFEPVDDVRVQFTYELSLRPETWLEPFALIDPLSGLPIVRRDPVRLPGPISDKRETDPIITNEDGAELEVRLVQNYKERNFGHLIPELKF